MRELYTAIINDEFPMPEDVEYGEDVSLVWVLCKDISVELLIEPYEWDTCDEECQHSAYVLYITKNNETTERLNSMLPDFRNMDRREIINTVIDYLLEYTEEITV